MSSRASETSPGWLTPSGVFLILANLAPLAAVLILDWSAFEIVLLFWAENVIIGVLNVLRMLLASGTEIGILPRKLFIAVFFSFHYGMFTYVHGIFVFALFGAGANLPNSPDLDLQTIIPLIISLNFGLPLLLLAASHVFSFLWNYIGRGEYLTANPAQLMFRPYGRVVVLHIAIIGGGMLVTFLGSPVFGLLVLVSFKIVLDLAAHRHEHVATLTGNRRDRDVLRVLLTSLGPRRRNG